MTILSFQSAVAAGHVGHSASCFPLQRLGHEVIAVDTVQFSNHPGHGSFTGQAHSPAHVAELVDGLRAGGFLADCRAVLSGYLGEPGTADVVLKAARDRRPGALYLCDPVMGDDGKVYVQPELVASFEGGLVAAADIVTPNRFELEILTGLPAATPAQAVVAARLLLAKGPRLVVVTGLKLGDGVGCLAVEADAAWAVVTPWLDFQPPIHGTGDLLSALLLAALLDGTPIPAALVRAMAQLFGVLAETHRLGRRELAVVAAQDLLVAPVHEFTALAVAL
ncbi:MAG: pyridoxal kinase PdxY [Alphaproteobacteria bacterium]|nr:pyridoxal kinase PdxY [Alphaproteobacteria bacterium]